MTHCIMKTPLRINTPIRLRSVMLEGQVHVSGANDRGMSGSAEQSAGRTAGGESIERRPAPVGILKRRDGPLETRAG